MSEGALPPVRPTPRAARALGASSVSLTEWSRRARGRTLPQGSPWPAVGPWSGGGTLRFGFCHRRLLRGFRVAAASPPPPRRRPHLVVAPSAAALPVPRQAARLPSSVPAPAADRHPAALPALTASVRRLTAALAYPLPSRRSSLPPPSPRRLPLCRRCPTGSPYGGRAPASPLGAMAGPQLPAGHA